MQNPHQRRQKIRVVVAALGITALIIAIVSALNATPAGAESPPREPLPPLTLAGPLVENSLTMDMDTGSRPESGTESRSTPAPPAQSRPQLGSTPGITIVAEPKTYPPPLRVSTEVDLQGHQAPDTSWWDDRDRSAGFQPDQFVWFDALLSTRLTAIYGGNPNGCVEGPVTLSRLHPAAYSWGYMAMSPTPLTEIRGFLMDVYSQLTGMASDIGALCGSDWSVSSVEHHLRVYEIPTDEVYYGDTPMWHPETGEVVSFLDWLWETTDSYDQMVGYLQSIAAPTATSLLPVAALDRGAYFLALELLRN